MKTSIKFLAICLAIAGTHAASADLDKDKLLDLMDNCTLVYNPDQIDADNDGFGNICDPDLNNDGIVNIQDLGLFRLVFFTSDPVADFNSDGVVNSEDLGILRSYFFLPPGPSGLVDP